MLQTAPDRLRATLDAIVSAVGAQEPDWRTIDQLWLNASVWAREVDAGRTIALGQRAIEWRDSSRFKALAQAILEAAKRRGSAIETGERAGNRPH